MANSVVVSVVVLLLLTLQCAFAHNVPYARPHIVVTSDPLNIDDELALGEQEGKRRRSGTESILTPDRLRGIYNIAYSATAGSGKTIALIDAYGASTAEADLAVFSNQWSLPACTTANGCFKKVNQTGGSTYPVDDSGWGSEVALDIQTAHSIAPGAKILLVVAKSSSLSDLFTAVNYGKAHADYVSMSFGSSEGSYVNSYDTTYFANAPKVAFFASTGDNGRGVEFPSTSPHVVAVGGTSVFVNPDFSINTEKGWSDSGGGCSKYFSTPSVQAATSGYSSLGCNGKRSVPDVAMDADPNSGVYVYYSYGCSSPPSCWYQVGGTSLASPLFAARAAIRGAIVNVTYVYGNNIQFRDITSGSNGFSCKVGLDLVTGRGAWIGDE